LRPSTAPPDAQAVNNLPGRFPTEEWRAHYWDVSAAGVLRDRHCVIELPRGAGRAQPVVQIGEDGVVKKVRRWGVTISSALFDGVGFDALAHLTHDAGQFPGGDDEEVVDVVMRAANFDLPGEFIIASDEHPFLLFDPSGALKGSYTKAHAYLGALAYFVTGGSNTATFNTMRHLDRSLYDRAVESMLKELRKK
jgi:hypothetical protein